MKKFLYILFIALTLLLVPKNGKLVFANQKNYDYAIKCFEKVIELSPDYPYAYYSLGMAYELKNMPEKAVEYYLLYTGIESDEKMLNIVNGINPIKYIINTTL